MVEMALILPFLLAFAGGATDLAAQGDRVPLGQRGAREKAVVCVQSLQLAQDGAAGHLGPLDLRVGAHLPMEFLGERERHVRHDD